MTSLRNTVESEVLQKELQITEEFAKISLEDMGKVKLMNRTDTKFVTDFKRVRKLLERISDTYIIQEINGMCRMPYFTLYFDTPDTDMYYQHQRGKKMRQKLRIRLYEQAAEIPFLEIKNKDNRGYTKKTRVLMEEGESLALYSDFLEKKCHYPHTNLIPQLENHFYRMTFVNQEMNERITIDTGLKVKSINTGEMVNLNHIGIIEWKRDGNIRSSKFESILRDLDIYRSGFSKYCMGMALTDDSLRQNRIKQKIRHIEKLRVN